MRCKWVVILSAQAHFYLDWFVCTIIWLWTKALLWLYYCSDICVQKLLQWYCWVHKHIWIDLPVPYHDYEHKLYSDCIITWHGWTENFYSLHPLCLLLFIIMWIQPVYLFPSTLQIILKIWAAVTFRCSMANISLLHWNLNFPFL
jgi:hypothetical protein